MLIFSNLQLWAKAHPHKICMIHSNKKISYLELLESSKRVASCLLDTLEQGKRILIKVSDPIEQIIFLVGASMAGIASLLIDDNIPLEYFKHIIHSVNPSLIIGDDFYWGNDTVKKLPVVKETDIFLGALSSGSTSLPKIIWRDHISWVKAFAYQSKIFKIGSEDKLYLTGSLCYTANLNSCLHILYEGGTVVFSKNKYPGTWIKELIQYEITGMFMVPANYRILVSNFTSPQKKVKSVVSAGAKLDIATAKALKTLFPDAEICEYYGASEVGHVSYSYFHDLIKYPDSVGKPFPCVDIQIENDLILVESPYVAPGYRPRASTGDIGTINNEGYLLILGRKNNMINSGGVKIVPEEIERIINSHPGVSESIVKGVTDAVRGEKIKAWVIQSDQAITVKTLKDFCRQHLPQKYCPHMIDFVDRFPLNFNGKIDRNKL